MYQTIKTYGNETGLSCCFRQWRAKSHCSTFHSYAIGVEVVFESATLDSNNWCMDFGGLKLFKAWLVHMFDHTMLVSKDDPHLEFFKEMAKLQDRAPAPADTEPWQYGAVCDLRIVDAVGCEAFAKLACDKMTELLMTLGVRTDVRVAHVDVFEHAANRARYISDKQSTNTTWLHG